MAGRALLWLSLVFIAAATWWSLAPFLLAPLELHSAPSFPALGDGAYDIVPVDAPAASGAVLQALSQLFTAPSFGPLLARGLLNQNSVWKLRELARQVPEHVVQRFAPLKRLSEPEFAAHQLQADAGTTALAAAATAGECKVPPVYWGVRDFTRAFKAGRSPVVVVQALLDEIPKAEKILGRIFMQIHTPSVLEQAKESERRWKEGRPRSVLEGVPVAVKDMIAVKGHMMRDGSTPGPGQVIPPGSQIHLQSRTDIPGFTL
jgi:hypothetical protein